MSHFCLVYFGVWSQISSFKCRWSHPGCISRKKIIENAKTLWKPVLSEPNYYNTSNTKLHDLGENKYLLSWRSLGDIQKPFGENLRSSVINFFGCSGWFFNHYKIIPCFLMFSFKSAMDLSYMENVFFFEGELSVMLPMLQVVSIMLFNFFFTVSVD